MGLQKIYQSHSFNDMENQYKNLLTSTTLIPLWAKAVESVSKDPILEDKHALELLKGLGYGLDYYSKLKQNPSQVGCCLRAKWMDDETLKFISEHPSCNVIQLGAGIDDRFRRIGMPEGIHHWYDLDLPEVAEMRQQVIPPVERCEVLSMNMLDTAWMMKLHDEHRPVLIIVEGVFMYIPQEEIAGLMTNIKKYLGECTMLLDSVPPVAVGRAKYHDVVKKYKGKLEYVFGVRDAEHMAELFPEVEALTTIYMSDLPKAYKFIWLLRMAYKIPYCHRNMNQRLIKIRIR